MKEKILDAARDLMTDFLYYDRKEDSTLGVGDIERAIIAGEVSIDEIIDVFRTELTQSVNQIKNG